MRGQKAVKSSDFFLITDADIAFTHVFFTNSSHFPVFFNQEPGVHKNLNVGACSGFENVAKQTSWTADGSQRPTRNGRSSSSLNRGKLLLLSHFTLISNQWQTFASWAPVGASCRTWVYGRTFATYHFVQIRFAGDAG
jgi:hypothetical protein